MLRAQAARQVVEALREQLHDQWTLLDGHDLAVRMTAFAKGADLIGTADCGLVSLRGLAEDRFEVVEGGQDGIGSIGAWHTGRPPDGAPGDATPSLSDRLSSTLRWSRSSW
jgi:hypothetical protein